MGEVKPDELRERMCKVHGGNETWDALDAACRAGNLPGEYCSWEGLLKILETTYPESVFPTLADDPKRDPGPRIVSLCRSLAALETELAEARQKQHVHPSCDATCPNYGPDLATVTAERDKWFRKLNISLAKNAALEAVVEAAREKIVRGRSLAFEKWDNPHVDARMKAIYEVLSDALSSLPKNQPAEDSDAK